ncbi:MAG: D-amino acid dehydrogenase [Sneathiella sp.]|nr:D-amino acid dehydrogenase [Sneathiella sp.]
MKVAVLGAGVTGVTTAYYLAKHGYEVTVYDRQALPAEETTFANGGQISVSQPFPWSSPDLPMKLLKWIGRKDAPLVFKLQADPKMWAWSLKFLSNARSSIFYKNSEKILKLALHSQSCLEALLETETLTFDRQQRGILKLFNGEQDAAHSSELAKWLNDNGVSQRMLSRAEVLEIEPALSDATSPFSGGTFSPNDESGDAHKFAIELEAAARRIGVVFKYNATIEGFENSAAHVHSVRVNGKAVKFDKFVLCTGSYSANLASKLNIKLPVYPVKGYSVSIPIEGDNNAPLTSITDETNHVVISRLGNTLRAAGTAEVNGYSLTPNKDREDLVLDAVMKLFPDVGDPAKATRWSGLRPMSADSVPIIGSTKLENFYLNTGHGHLGWTLSCGSAQILAAHIVGEATNLDISAYNVDRF